MIGGAERRRALETRSPITLPPSRSSTLAGLAGHGLLWGIGISATAGAVIGTAVFPVLGTLSGLYFGAIYGPIPATVAAVLVVAAAWPHWPATDRARVFRAMLVALYVYGALVEVAVWALLRSGTPRGLNLVDEWLVVMWLGVVLAVLLPWVARRITATYVRLAARS